MNLSFSTLQEFLANNTNLDLQFPTQPESVGKWWAKLIEHKKKLVRQVRKMEEIPIERIVEVFLMVTSFASSRYIDIQKAVTVGYPGYCIYCDERPCDCTQPGKIRPLLRIKAVPKPNLKITLPQFQEDDWLVYPNDKSFEAKLIRAQHLSEEVDELIIEILREASAEKLFEEIGDVLERLFSFASTFDINLAMEIAGFVNSRLV